jgi:hypothetical protein
MLNVICIRHGLIGDIIILIGLMARHVKVGKVRIFLVIIRGYWGSQLVSEGLVILKAQMHLIRRGHLLGVKGSHIRLVCDLAIGFQNLPPILCD